MPSPCGQKPLVDYACPRQAVAWAITMSYFHIWHVSFGLKEVGSVDNIADWWRKQTSIRNSRALYKTLTGSCSELTELGEFRWQAASTYNIKGESWDKYHSALFFVVWSHTSTSGLYFLLPGSVDWLPTGCIHTTSLNSKSTDHFFPIMNREKHKTQVKVGYAIIYTCIIHE